MLSAEELMIQLLLFTGDIAIDEVSFTENQRCSTTPTGSCDFKCVSDSKCLSQAKVCDFVSDCADGSDETQCMYNCDFDSG